MIPAVRNRKVLSPLVHLANNPLSFVGVLLATTGGVSWLFLLPLNLRGVSINPYLGILFFLVLPILFFLGLASIPVGIYLRLRRDPNTDVPARTFIFGGKAAPGYFMAKRIIKLITATGDLVECGVDDVSICDN